MASFHLLDPTNMKSTHEAIDLTSIAQRLRSSATPVGLLTLAVALCLLAPHPLLAQESTTEVFGFGGWAFGNSDPYPYLAGGGEGENEYDFVEAALAIVSKPTDRLTLSLQIFGGNDLEGEEVELELASAQWRLSDQLDLRLGQSRLPFGIYTEIFDIGTLRPFFFLPQSIYGPSGFVTEAYKGVGLTHRFESDSSWALTTDVYVGEVETEFDQEAVEVALGEEEDEEEGEDESDLEVRDVLGGRFVLDTPVNGLRFGFSAYAGEPEAESHGLEEGSEEHNEGEEGEGPEHGLDWGDHRSWSLFADYETDRWLLRSEYGHSDQVGRLGIDSLYVEAAYRFNSHWQLAARADRADFDLESGLELPVGGESLDHHEEITLGLNYWFSSNLVIKVAFHRVDGNAFVHPEGRELVELIETGELDDRTDLFTFGVQFSF